MLNDRFTATIRAVEDLPHACRCGKRWSGMNTAHCGACHETFGGVRAFDDHRRDGVCVTPTAAGLSPIPGRAVIIWGRVAK